MVSLRKPKAGRHQYKVRVAGLQRTRNCVEVAIYMPQDLLDQFNEAYMKSPHRFFSRWAVAAMKEACK